MRLIVVPVLLLLNCCSEFAQAYKRSEQKPDRRTRAAAFPSLPLVASGLSVASVIAFHEAGHFLAAKLQGIKVESFNVGYGPKLFSIGGKPNGEMAPPQPMVRGSAPAVDNKPVPSSTEFALRAIPLGGYVSFPTNQERNDEGEVVRTFSDPDLLQNRPPLQRAIVISAGVLANIFLTFVLSVGASFTIGTSTPVYGNGIVVNALTDPTAPAAAAGLRVNDVILSVDGHAVPPSEGAVQAFVTQIRRSEGKQVTLEIQRPSEPSPQQAELIFPSNTVPSAIQPSAEKQPMQQQYKQLTIRVTPGPNKQGKVSIGVGINPVVKDVVNTKATNAIQAVQMGAEDTYRLLSYTLSQLASVFTAGVSNSDLGGPIAVVTAGAKLAEYSPAALLGFIAALSVNLAVVNALPFPALDGGQLVYVLVEMVARRPVPRRVQEVVTGICACLLLVLGVTTLIGDVQRLSDPLSNMQVENSAMLPGDK